MRVLVVDDDLVTGEIIVEDLRHFGYEVAEASGLPRGRRTRAHPGMYRLVVPTGKCRI